jgi:hypothetical protein
VVLTSALLHRTGAGRRRAIVKSYGQGQARLRRPLGSLRGQADADFARGLSAEVRLLQDKPVLGRDPGGVGGVP